MFYIFLTILCSTGIFVTFRLFKRYKIDNVQAITTNYIVAAAFGFSISYGNYSITDITSSSWIWLSLILGVIFIAVFYLFALSSQKVGVALTSMASKMSVIIPVTFGIILYHESLNILKIMGIFTALIAFYLSIKTKGKRKASSLYYVLPLIIFIGTGVVDSAIKYAQHNHIQGDKILFISMIFLTAFVCGIFVFIARMLGKNFTIKLKSILGGIILGLLNFGSAYFVIDALSVMESSIVFPIYNSGVISLSALTGFFAFKEKLNIINWIGLLIAIIAIILMANA